ncbi:hypothetical protein DID88_008453 [Monilinia fructigena]|uniref:Uncharacterized protein n=1 Tax=Monilinia fructigena TaxID=38457 RepID=A0A395J5C4_9HELO|nr:hypothetical protein DID88_008453 [Monilinia fructigena]
MSTNLYPPVRAPTLDQELLSSSGTRIHPSQYKTLDFSPLFQPIYGRPTTTYHAWARLWSIPSSRILEGRVSPVSERDDELPRVCGVPGARVTDWSVEAPFQKSLLKPEDINDNDYDETDDEHEHEHDHENRNNNQDHDESNDENNDSAVAMEGIEKKQNPTPNSTKAKSARCNVRGLGRDIRCESKHEERIQKPSCQRKKRQGYEGNSKARDEIRGI